jgi:hypothetical protein
MKAIRLLEHGGQLVFNNVPRPTIARDEILVKIKSTAVNHLDLVKASGTLRQILPIDLPWIPGHEFSGVVEQIGSDVAGYAPGDAVGAAHSKKFANSGVYRRSSQESWRKAVDGLPDPEGRRVPVLAPSDVESGVFYLHWEGELYQSANSGTEWQKLTVDWAKRHSPQHAGDIAVVESLSTCSGREPRPREEKKDQKVTR